ncbi:hypothetical protein RB601_008359 [Gaeumannomyces tritici]
MASFPPPPVNTIDWSNVGFLVREVNGHIESHYSKKTGRWSPLRWVTDPFIRIHGMAPALNYGQQAYEGLKAFRAPGDQAIQIFRPDRNAVRMQHSAEFISIPPVPTSLFLDAVKAAVSLNAEFVPPHDTGAAMYIRPQIYGSSAQLGLSAPEEYTFAVYVLPTGVYHGTHPVKALILDEFDRAAPNGTGSAKVGGNYAPVLRWSDKARAEGYGITLHLDSATREEVDEFSTSGFIGALEDGQGGVTLVVPDSKNVIDSVTSESVQQIGRSFGWKVEKRQVSGSRDCIKTARRKPNPTPERGARLDRRGLTWTHGRDRTDKIHGAAQLLGNHGGRDRGGAGAHPVHHAQDGRLGPQVPGSAGQAAHAPRGRDGRGDGDVHPRVARRRRPALPQAPGTAQGHPAGQGQGRVWLVRRRQPGGRGQSRGHCEQSGLG